jgi:phosphatidylserine decarboxylase
MYGAGVIVVTLVGYLLWKLAQAVTEAKSPRYLDLAESTVKTEHRTWTNAIMVVIQRTGCFPIDGALFQWLARRLTAEFNRANIKFKDEGKDPVMEIRNFGTLHGIDVSMLGSGHSYDPEKWLWSKAPHEYESINDFFMRKHRSYSFGDHSILSPATAVVRRYPDARALEAVDVKGVRYTLENCGIPQAEEYVEHECFYFYLSPADYHCFHSPMDGVVDSVTDLTGLGHCSGSVKPDLLASSPSILAHNRRFVVVLRQGSFKLALVVIGGFLVDSVRIDPLIKARTGIRKGQLVGSFALGGSAILMLTSQPVISEPVLSEALDQFRYPVKVSVGRNFAKRDPGASPFPGLDDRARSSSANPFSQT